jgi:hypothetical protein
VVLNQEVPNDIPYHSLIGYYAPDFKLHLVSVWCVCVLMCCMFNFITNTHTHTLSLSLSLTHTHTHTQEPANVPNLNSPEELEKVKTAVFATLKELDHAPSVQMHTVPPDM